MTASEAAVRRGSVITVADRGGGEYAGKPRPAVVIQADSFPIEAMGSAVVCLLTTQERDAPLVRLPVEPSKTLPLRQASWIAVDRIITVSRDRIGGVLGRLEPEDMARLERALVVFLGIG